MRVEFKASELFTVCGEGATHKEAFKEVASMVEPFSISECGKCRSHDIYPVVRTVDKFTYYEMKCRKCRSKMSYGQSTENGALYPRRKYHDRHPAVKAGQAEVGDWLPNNGWEEWVNERDDEAVGEEK